MFDASTLAARVKSSFGKPLLLLIEQSPQVIADSVDRMYLLENGRIVGHGSLQELGGADALAQLYLGVA